MSLAVDLNKIGLDLAANKADILLLKVCAERLGISLFGVSVKVKMQTEKTVFSSFSG